MVTIRPVPVDALDARRDAFVDAYRQIWDAPHWDDVDRDDALAELQEARDCDATTVIAEPEDAAERLVGFTWAFHHACRNDPYPADKEIQQHRTDGTAYIATIGVIPEERGNGIGARLLDRLLDALTDDYERALLRTHPDAARAWRIYQERGFSDLDVADPERPDRTYLVKVLI